MGLHHEILAKLVEELKLQAPECAIVLVGSVAAGTARETSDLDFNLFFPDEASALGVSRFVDADNRWQLQVKDVVGGVRVDVAWETYAGLEERLRGDGAADCWSFARGTILYNPQNVVEPLLIAARRWFEEHPEVAEKLEGEYARAKVEWVARREKKN